jgi:uncharacterized protein (DUF2141 family)
MNPQLCKKESRMNPPPVRRSFLGPFLVGITVLAAAGTSLAQGDAPTDAGTPDAGTTALLSVRLVELRNDNGQIGCGLWSSERGFPKDRSIALQTKWCSIVSKESLCSFDPIPAGTYAVACFHDENNNGILDTGLFGIPSEGVVASNHAKGFMGPPSFKDAKFWLPGRAAELRLKMGY